MSKQDGSQRVGLKNLCDLSKSEQRPVSRNIGCVIAARLFEICKALKVPLSSMFERDPHGFKEFNALIARALEKM
jgi:hypothetical protein